MPQVVDDALRDSIAAFPEELQESLKEKFNAYYANPETHHVEQVLRKRMTDAHAQSLLFSPTREQAALYVTLIQGPPKGAPESHPCSVVCQRYLSMWYLCHARHWPLAKEFILHGGLDALVDLFEHDNMHFRGQALDVFTQVTSNPDFDWFTLPSCAESKAIHSKMLLLTNTSDFVKSLVANKGVAAMSYYALQILAFFMSWVRKLYTKGELRLSSALLATLSDWKSTPGLSEEERTLATKVFDDFNRWPAADAEERQQKKELFEEVEYPEGTLNLKQAHDAILALDYDQAIPLCSSIIDLGDATPAPDRMQAYSLRGHARFLRQLDRNDLKKLVYKMAIDDFTSALDMEVSVDGYFSRVQLIEEKATALAHLHIFSQALATLTPEDWMTQDESSRLEDKAREIRALQEEYNQLHGQKHMKEQTIFDAIMLRRGKEVAQQAVEPLQSRVVATSNQDTNDEPAAPSIPKPKKAKVSPPNKTKTSLVPPLARKLLKCKQDPAAMAKFLGAVSGDDVADSLVGILNPDVLRSIVAGAALLSPDKAHDVVRALQTLPAFSLVLDLADDPALVASMTTLTLQ
ncbi:hypothetical protein Ae201684_002820 [Aphanomyces euteiches]|uniref:Uncharacterized protein n=1 Tax=Aphanomyces euteiches TaxID=100861 RepID=A0A6G0XP99_9STRA|nr:hypothetical protein Ae201684_002820 [Aphanomyces euteiches]KAH9157489.1 hypothetical protein AeRB84_000688 [Aphanomyces euteiches]